MRSLNYYPATSWEDAVAFLGKNEKAQVIAGGSDLLGWIKGCFGPRLRNCPGWR